MNEAEVMDVIREGMIVLIKVSAPPLLAGMAIGLVVSIFQSLTQIQEMTLTFVPKVLVVFISLLVFMPFMLHEVIDYTHMVMDKVAGGG
ncbi:MAG: flagellar biosynthesis protein FliQ [Rhodospirillales bacterium]|jgi:flagellar biosynthetic protein FliQ|nr:flagellar biosynthesis protein FliQ [Rhodospirillales bacterium]MDK9721238.1 flagellar biosynthesis protein FliQ [Rhodospirillales bacterium]